jgi:hypothetical protein
LADAEQRIVEDASSANTDDDYDIPVDIRSGKRVGVAAYSHKAGDNLLKRTLPDNASVGTVDKSQDQKAEVVILSMTSSSIEDISSGIDFLLNKHRLNVAIS